MRQVCIFLLLARASQRWHTQRSPVGPAVCLAARVRLRQSLQLVGGIHGCCVLWNGGHRRCCRRRPRRNRTPRLPCPRRRPRSLKGRELLLLLLQPPWLACCRPRRLSHLSQHAVRGGRGRGLTQRLHSVGALPLLLCLGLRRQLGLQRWRAHLPGRRRDGCGCIRGKQLIGGA